MSGAQRKCSTLLDINDLFYSILFYVCMFLLFFNFVTPIYFRTHLDRCVFELVKSMIVGRYRQRFTPSIFNETMDVHDSYLWNVHNVGITAKETKVRGRDHRGELRMGQTTLVSPRAPVNKQYTLGGEGDTSTRLKDTSKKSVDWHLLFGNGKANPLSIRERKEEVSRCKDNVYKCLFSWLVSMYQELDHLYIFFISLRLIFPRHFGNILCTSLNFSPKYSHFQPGDCMVKISHQAKPLTLHTEKPWKDGVKGYTTETTRVLLGVYWVWFISNHLTIYLDALVVHQLASATSDQPILAKS